MSNFTKVSVFLSVFVTVALCQTLICYDCDPVNDSEEVCKHANDNNARNTVCQPRENTTTLCLSSYIQHQNATRSGIYRGCVNKPLEVQDVCDWMKETNTNNSFVSCYPCNETRCNTIVLYADGTSAAISIYNFYILIFVNVILVMIFGYSSN